MSTFKKGAIATVTAAALAAGTITPAFAIEDKYTFSGEFKDNKCTVKISNGVETSTEALTKEEVKEKLEGAIKELKAYQATLKDNEALLAKEKKANASDKRLQEIQGLVDYYNMHINRISRYKTVLNACANGKSISKTDADGQALLSSPDGESLSPAGIGVVVAGVVVVVLGAIVAALPMLKPMLPPQIAAMLP